MGLARTRCTSDAQLLGQAILHPKFPRPQKYPYFAGSPLSGITDRSPVCNTGIWQTVCVKWNQLATAVSASAYIVVDFILIVL